MFLSGCASQAPAQIAGANVVEALSGVPAEGFRRAYEPIAFTFPADHGAHPGYQTEWWYFTGNLADGRGDQYGYQLTFFRSATTPEMPQRQSGLATNQLYMAHFAVTDGVDNRHHSFERFSRGAGALAGAVGEPAFEAWLEDWSVAEIEPGKFEIQASADIEDGPVALSLTLSERRPPVLHGDAGLSRKSAEPGNASYYYSLVGLESTGTITTPRTSADVTGVSWMDHEFGTSALSENAVGWDWFSIQLDNGTVLMFAQIRTTDGGRVGDFEGTLVYPDGSQEPVGADDFSLATLDEWTSEHSDITYPSGWRISFPNHDLDLTVEPLVADQEMKVSYVYWEGAVDIEGTMLGEDVSGQGYVELTGYGSDEAVEYQR